MEEIGTARPSIYGFWSQPSNEIWKRLWTTSYRNLVRHPPVVRLTFFDGIGVASEALRQINDNL